MTIFTFVQKSGQTLFKLDAAMSGLGGASNEAPGEAISRYIASQDLRAKDLLVTYDGASKTVTVTGVAPDQPTKEKIVLCCGNVYAVAKVDDQLTLAQTSPAAYPPSSMYVVKAGATLSKIAKTVYGDPDMYQTIQTANEPMLKHPDSIYPGQQLRIP